MEVITVKSKFRIVIPERIREQAGVDVGDLLEASMENGKITLTPQSAIDRHLAEGLRDFKQGRTHGSYASAEEAVAALQARVQKPLKKRAR